MLTLAASPVLKDTSEIKRLIRALSYGSSGSSSKEPFPSSPPLTPTKEKRHPLRKSYSVKDRSRNSTLPWAISTKGSYSLNQEAGHSRPYAYAADFNAELPMSAKEMYVLAEGATCGDGAINIYEDTQDNALGGSNVLVDVRVYYDNPQVVKMTKVKTVWAADDEWGVRIHTEASSDVYDRYVNINVRIPRSTSSGRLRLPAFRTHLPNFTHTVGALQDVVDFDSITLSSAEKPIIVKSLSARRVRLRTTNASIEGRFASESHISLRTANAPINADIVQNNDGVNASNVELITSNAEVIATINIASTASKSSSRSQQYRILAKTAEKPITIRCPVAPTDAKLQFEVQTTNAPVTVHLPSTYVGRFELHSTPLKPVVTRSEGVGEGMAGRVVVHERERRGLVAGYVAWDGRQVAENTRGDVTVRTSNAEVCVFV
ncbi:hypothetical protein BC835DRAFT_376418 [Cytidiella melzeri]|nr:hypothetical protein BC835DRAFT_376418 [Cytidiella melzeri]